MPVDFSQPQRQSKTGIYLLFFYSVYQYGKAFFPIALIYIIRPNKPSVQYILLSILAIVILLAVVAYLKYRNFTFYINHQTNEFTINEGIFTKTITSIPLHKIQQVNIDQSFLHKLVGTFELSVDTAGSGKNEGNIKAISKIIALDLKTKLTSVENLEIEKKVDSEENNVSINLEPKPISFLKIKFATLVKIGLTSSYGKSLALIFVALITFYQHFEQFIDFDSIENAVNESQIINFSDIFYVLKALLIVIALALSIVIVVNLFRIILKYFDYNISKQSDTMLFSYGLFNSKNSIIKFNKVQIVSVTQNFFQKKLRLSEVAISHAAGLEQNPNDKAKSLLEIPGCHIDEISAVFQTIFDTVPNPKLVLKPNFRQLGFSLFIYIIMPVALLCGARNFYYSELASFDYFVIGYTIISSLILLFRYLNNKMAVSQEFIRYQSGAWDITNQFASIYKIQAITTSQLFWHKNLNIGTLTIHTAGGDITFELGNFEIITQYVNIWLYKIESSNKNWM